MSVGAVKVLNPMGRDYLSFSMERDGPPSRPVPTLGTADVTRRPDQDARMLIGLLVPTHEIISHLNVLQDIQPGPKSLGAVIINHKRGICTLHSTY